MSTIGRIREKITDRNYYLSYHAEEEMTNDNFERRDLENSILKGYIIKKMTQDPRGTRCNIEGPALDDRIMHSLCRFSELGPLIIITVYKKE